MSNDTVVLFMYDTVVVIYKYDDTLYCAATMSYYFFFHHYSEERFIILWLLVLLLPPPPIILRKYLLYLLKVYNTPCLLYHFSFRQANRVTSGARYQVNVNTAQNKNAQLKVKHCFAFCFITAPGQTLVCEMTSGEMLDWPCGIRWSFSSWGAHALYTYKTCTFERLTANRQHTSSY